MNWRAFIILYGIIALSAAPVIAAAEPPPVTVTNNDQLIDFNNGFFAISMSKQTGQIYSMRAPVKGQYMELGNGRDAIMFDFDNQDKRHVAFGAGGTAKLISSTPDAAEMSYTIEPTDACPFRVDMHYILHRGDSGVYFYIQYLHGPGMAACKMEQTRAVIRPVIGTAVFTNYVIDDQRKGPYPYGSCTTVSDTTWLYDFDHQIHSKYDYSAFIADDLVHGIAGNGVGLWLIQPGREYVNGGPLRQELTIHQDSPNNGQQNNIVLWMLLGNHFGGPLMPPIAADQVWTRFYGPAMLYFNQSPSIDIMWADAKKKAAVEDAKWPYDFVKNDDYPIDRGTVSGQIKVASGDSTKGAWVVLAAPGDKDWCMSSGGYEFWTKADATGHFTISKVRPGNYTLFVTGGNQFEDFLQEGLSVKAGANDVGVLNWQPITHGQKLWQVGVPDRSTQEFKDGLNFRHYTNFTRYGTTFPNDVTFTIGKSKESEDWNFAQWGWYVKQPFWSIKFDEPKNFSGLGTLTLAFAAFDYPRGLQVSLNGQVIGNIHLQKSGMASYRSGGQDSLRQTVYLPFDASFIKSGPNEVQLALNGAVPFDANSSVTPNTIGSVMYDALRMEVDSNSKAP